MPPINIYQCNNCEFEAPSGWGGYMYVENDQGERIPCRHPGEASDVEDVLGVHYSEIGLRVFGGSDLLKAKWWWSKKKKAIYRQIRERTGYNSYCLCHYSFHKTILDLGDEKSVWRSRYGFNRPKDKRICKKCGSHKVSTVFELIGQLCPICQTGQVVEIASGTES